MPSINRTALVNYSAEQMFALVNDIERYPEFMLGCSAAKVISSNELELVGQLTLSKAGLSQTFTTRNQLKFPSRIEMGLEEGNFSRFSSAWNFESLSDSACKISLSMDFEFGLGLMNFAMDSLFSSSASNLVDAVVKRAELLYG
jgi:ribosome-associated toxin RatA of RatAB toxin-antitoxin module